MRVSLRSRGDPSRCARCFDDLDAEPWRCPACATALHAECQLEWSPCPTLGCPTLVTPAARGAPTIRLAERRRWVGRAVDALAVACDRVMLYGTPLGAGAFLAGVVPAFERVFREVGVSLHPATRATLWLGGWAATPVGLVALVGLIALLRRAHRTRPSLPAAVFAAGLVLVVLLGASLFLSCIEISQKL